MVTTIYCTPTAKGVHSFYIEASGETHFVFSQAYRPGVNEYFRDGVRLDDALNFSRAKGDNAIKRTMEKLPSYIKYIEREYDLEILHRTAKKNAKHNRRAA
jgi:hypothetical protein